MRFSHVLLPMLVAVLGGLVWGGCPTDARTVSAADVGPYTPAPLSSNAVEDFVGVHHWDAAPSSSDRFGNRGYYRKYGYEYAYPEEPYGYEASAEADNEANEEADAQTPPLGTTDPAEEDADGSGRDAAAESMDDSTEASTSDDPTQGHSYQYEYYYEDGYASDDSEEVDQPSAVEGNDEPTSVAQDPDAYGYAVSKEEYLRWLFESEYGYDEEEYQYAGFDEAAAGHGSADDALGPSTFDEPYIYPADEETSGQSDSSSGYSPAGAFESYGSQYLEGGAEADAWPIEPREEAYDDAQDDYSVRQEYPLEGNRAGPGIGTSGPRLLGAVISAAADSLDRLSLALRGVSRHLEGLR
ncbi:MAG: hypothetical protein JW809_12545 [Pirellulales bacterium]|nr:hypothetical protein [Pirellulales bacterium]